MRKLIAALACALTALAIAGPAGAGVSVGVNDDAGKWDNGGTQFWTTMTQNGLKQDAMTVLWDSTQPTTIPDEGAIRASLAAAQAAGVKVVFDVYPKPAPTPIFAPNGSATYQQFGDFLTKLATTFPQVTEYVVMNECNQNLFVKPQFDGSGTNASAAICGQALAAGYDALKAVSPGIFVWGVGLSPRGNDNAQATSNVSNSPVKFLAALGLWYRSSGRTKPIMDGFDFHPYPVPQSLPFATGYADTDNASVTNLPRIYQAFYDAFKGTAQPTIGQQAGGGLPVSLNEVGIQTDSTGKPGYDGNETSATAEGGVRGDTATETYQAQWYKQMLDYVACDPNVRVVNIFHLVDETSLAGWQSGLYFVGYQPKQSQQAVAGWIAQTGGNCSGAAKPWTPGGQTIGGFTGGTTGGATGGSVVTTGRLTQLFSGTPLALGGSSLGSLLVDLGRQFGPARQDTRVTASLFYVGAVTTASARGLSGAALKPAATATALVKKGKKLSVALTARKLKAGYYKLRFDFKAVKGSVKASAMTGSFYLGANGKLRK